MLRDSFFYSVSLIALFAFFNDGEIYWYEALVLLFVYSTYAIFMKFNGGAEYKLRSCMGAISVMVR